MAAPEMERHPQTLRFCRWLINEINSGNYEGVRWLDTACTVFRIPWKHNSRKDITTNDYKIFKAWAIASGRYDEKVQDSTKWKTNFRCALNSTKKFQLLQDNSKNPDDPHNVYKIIQHGPFTVEAANVPAETCNKQNHAEEEDALFISPNTEEAPVLHQAPSQLQQQIEMDLQTLSLKSHPQEMVSLQNRRAAYHQVGNRGDCYPTSNTAPNRYPYSPDTLQWLLDQCNLSQNGSSPQQLSWAPSGGLAQVDGPCEEILVYSNQQVSQNGYLLQENEVVNKLGENTYHQPASQWQILAMTNGYAHSPALLPQQHPHSALPCTIQLHNNAEEVLVEERPPHSNPHCVQNTFPNEAPQENRVAYQTLNGPTETSYHQWIPPTAAEQNGFAPPPDEHPTLNMAPSQNNAGTFPPNLEVTIYYRGTVFHEVEVNMSKCMFTYQVEAPNISLGCTQVVQFPSPENLPDRKQTKYTKELLQKVGLLLEQRHMKIYATRLGKCKVFWAFSKQLENMAQNFHHEVLPRDTGMEIFNYEEFWQAIFLSALFYLSLKS
uniref:Interferon regulatory factor 7 n=1 Tax=Sphenodon punctatus TaxID=8508 RepID=A0A8D0GL77_SPHPU